MPTVLAEGYARLLMQTVAQHRRVEYAIKTTGVMRGRLAVLPTGIFSSQVRYHATLVRLVTITEAFVVTQLISKLELYVPSPTSEFINEIYLKEEKSATNGWGQMRSRFKKSVGGVELTSCAGYQTVNSMVDARNAIVHGLGSFTKRQQRDPDLPNVIARLAKIGIVVDTQDRLVVSDAALKLCAMDCRSFIIALDNRLQAVRIP